MAIAGVVLTVIFLLVVFVIDYKYHLIPNKLTVPVLLAGLALAAWNGVLLDHFLAALVGFVLLLIPFALGWVGGGDVKFLAALGALAGWTMLIHSVLIGLVLSGLWSLYRLFRRGGMRGIAAGFMFAWYNKSAHDTGAPNEFIPLGTCMSAAGLLFIIIRALG